MGSHLTIAAAALVIGLAAPLGGSGAALAAPDCAAAARAVQQANPGEILLSAEPDGDKCKITTLAKSEDGVHQKKKVRYAQ